MSERINLADPEFEPTDAQLIELSVRAFAGVRSARENAFQKLRAEIAVARESVLRELDDRPARSRART